MLKNPWHKSIYLITKTIEQRKTFLSKLPRSQHRLLFATSCAKTVATNTCDHVCVRVCVHIYMYVHIYKFTYVFVTPGASGARGWVERSLAAPARPHHAPAADCQPAGDARRSTGQSTLARSPRQTVRSTQMLCWLQRVDTQGGNMRWKYNSDYFIDALD